MQLLTGKRALVTGANDGIGRAIAETLAREGAIVAAHGRNEERLEDVLGTIEGAGGRAFPVTADLRDMEAVKAMCADALAKLSGIDIVVNNAGVAKGAYALDTDETLWDEHFDVNVKACFIVCTHTLPVMIEQGSGGCVLINASISAKLGEAGLTAYNSSKHAVLGFTRCLAAEMGEKGITVNCLCPGLVETKMAHTLMEDLGLQPGLSREEFVEEVMHSVPTPLRAFVQPQDVAELALFLVSDRARYITGQAINVDAGYCMF